MQDTFCNQYEMNLAFYSMGTKTEKDGFGTESLKYIDEVKRALVLS